MTETTHEPNINEIRDAKARARKTRSRLGILLGVLALVGIFATVLYVAWLGRRPVELKLSQGRIALLPFSTTSRPTDSWLAWGLSTMVAETLAQTSGLEVLPSDRLRSILSQRGIDLLSPESRAKAKQLAFAAGASLVVDGHFGRREEGIFVLGFELFTAEAATHKGQLEAADPLTLAGQLVDSLANGMAPGLETVRLQTVFGSDPFLARLYGEGVQQLAEPGNLDNKALAARPYFEILLRNDPSFTRAKARLVDVLRDLGELGPARRLDEQLLQESAPRGELDLQISSFRSLGLIEAVEGDEVAAAEQFRLGHRAALARRDRAAELLMLGELVRLALGRSDRNKAEELTVEMLQVQKALRDRLGEAESLLQIGSLYLAGGDLEGSAKMLQDAQALEESVGDNWGVQRIAASLGEIFWRRGDVVAAADQWEKALEFYRQQGDRRRILMMTRNLGEAQIRAGRFSQAEKLVIDLRDLAVELGDPITEAEASVSQAWLQLRLGFPFQAQEPLDRALALDSYLADRKRLRFVIAWLAYEQGDYEQAVRGLSELKTDLKTAGAASSAWSEEDEAFLQAFTAARTSDKRLDLPGETGYRPPA